MEVESIEYEWGLTFEKVEVDMLLENGGCVMTVEVKTALTIEDIQDHKKRLEILRGYADAHQDHRAYFGSVAGAIINDSVRRYALKTW